MKVTDEILNEWSFRCHDGVVDLNDPKKLLILKEILDENGITLEEAEEETSEAESDTNIKPITTMADVTELKKIFESVSGDYSKYLTVFSLFDPNSLGTISEVLFTKLIESKGVKTIHTGGSQGLTDLIVNGHPISLKTTDSINKIGLGSSTEMTNSSDSVAISKLIKDLEKENPEITSLPVIELKDKLGVEWDKIDNRLKAIAEKLSGKGNQEFFVWVEKVIGKEDKIIEALNIHIVKYDYDKTMKTFYNGYLKTSGKSGWGIKHKEGNFIIQADTAKLLNVTPEFVRNCSTNSMIPIVLAKTALPKADITTLITTKLFKSLDSIYSDIFGSEEKTN